MTAEKQRGLHVTYSELQPISNASGTIRQTSVKPSLVKLHENAIGNFRPVACGQTE
jgi:hypothetical protein